MMSPWLSLLRSTVGNLANKFSVCSNHPSGSARIREKSAAFGEISPVKMGLSFTAISDGAGEGDGEEGTTALVTDSTGGAQGVRSEAFAEEIVSSLTCGGRYGGIFSPTHSFPSMVSVDTTRLAEFIAGGGSNGVVVVVGKVSSTSTFSLCSFCSAWRATITMLSRPLVSLAIVALECLLERAVRSAGDSRLFVDMADDLYYECFESELI